MHFFFVTFAICTISILWVLVSFTMMYVTLRYDNANKQTTNTHHDVVVIIIIFVSFHNRYLVSLPKLTPEGYRIHVFCHALPDPNEYEPNDAMKRVFMMCDWKMKTDLTAGEIIIMHMNHSSLAHWGRYNLMTLSRFLTTVTVSDKLLLLFGTYTYAYTSRLLPPSPEKNKLKTKTRI